MTNLDHLYAEAEALGTSPYDLDWKPVAEELDNFLIGALSASVDAEVWQEAVAVAVRCVVDSRLRRAERAVSA